MYDALILLACGMKPHNGRTGFKMDLDAHTRTAAASHLYHQGVAGTIAVAGGYMRHPRSLSSVVVDALEHKYHVPRNRILSEEESDDTTENAQFIGEVLEREGMKNLGLVTNTYHLSRALEIFRRYGMNPIGFSAEEVLYRSKDHRVRNFATVAVNSPDNLKKVEGEETMMKILSLPAGHHILRGLAHLKMKLG